MDSSLLEFLPPETLFEILDGTTSLLQTLDMSEELKALISKNLTFMASYTRKTGNLSGFMVQTLVPFRYLQRFVSPNQSTKGFTFPPRMKFEKVKIEASSLQGILCFVGYIGSECCYYVAKPCTDQWEALPSPKYPYSTEKIALVVMNLNPILHFKIFRISKPTSPKFDCCNYECQVFDSKTWQWKDLEELIISGDDFFITDKPAVHVKACGLVCFLTHECIVAFNIDEETSFTIPLPQPTPSSEGQADYNAISVKIVDYQSKLGLVYTSADNIEFWILQNRRWEMIKSFNAPPSFFNQKKIHFIPPPVRASTQIFPFQSDWEPLQLRQTE